MKLALPPLPFARRALTVAIWLGLAASSIAAQNTKKPKDPDKPKDKYVSSRFWDSTDPFPLTLSVNLKQLQSDKGDPGPWRAATVSYQDATPKTHAARVRTRG